MECGCYNHIDQDPTKTRIVHCALHAAAPDMLEALKAIEPMTWNDSPLLSVYRDEIKQLQAAIAKAKGENL